jgi:hypothetical protein
MSTATQLSVFCATPSQLRKTAEFLLHEYLASPVEVANTIHSFLAVTEYDFVIHNYVDADVREVLNEINMTKVDWALRRLYAVRPYYVLDHGMQKKGVHPVLLSFCHMLIAPSPVLRGLCATALEACSLSEYYATINPDHRQAWESVEQYLTRYFDYQGCDVDANGTIVDALCELLDATRG